jgi:hypothetical protein
MQILPTKTAQLRHTKASVVQSFQYESIPYVKFQGEHLVNLRLLQYSLGQSVLRLRQLESPANIEREITDLARKG